MTSQTPVELVTAFFGQLARRQVDDALAVVDDDVVYQNVSLPTVRGKERFSRIMRGLNGRTVGFDAQFRAVSGDDDGVVLSERVDELRIGPLRIRFWVCGRIEVRDGVIVLWRDYFDYVNFTLGVVRGVVGLAVPAALPKLTDRISAR